MTTIYTPDHFAEPRAEILHDFLRAHPFCSLVTHGGEGFIATHLPLLLDTTQGAQGVLRGHISRANFHQHTNGAQALAIFRGADAYVSPSYYPSKRRHGRVVPTWNYSVVHVAGVVRFIDDPALLMRTVEELTTLMEHERDAPWKVTDAPADYLAKMVQHIVGVELNIHGMEAKFKLSQNREQADFKGVIEGLNERSSGADRELARTMGQLVSDSNV